MTDSQPRLAAPRTPDARSAPALRWGILGTGWIAERFARSLLEHTDHEVAAVGSRSRAGAERFLEHAPGARPHGSYVDLVNDPDVDVVYVATPHPQHADGARLAIEAGKHVLVEKPLTINAAEARTLVALARERGVFMMEAFWTKFLPRFDVVRQALASGVVGDVHTVIADLAEGYAPEHRIWRPDLAGGPMLDLGTYPFGLVTWVLGEPEEVHAFGMPTATRVNGQTAAILRFASGAQAVVHTSLLGASPSSAAIVGANGIIELPGVFCLPGDVVLRDHGGAELDRWHEEPVGHDAMFHQAVEVARCVDAGLAESPLHPLDLVVSSLTTMDAVRRRSGELFDGE